MAYSERILILTEAEQEVFYGNPQLTNNDQRYFFALNDKERKVANQLRGRRQRCMFVVLLGYFKSKPVVLQPRYFQLKDDLKYVSDNTLPGLGHRPFNLSPKESERIYQRIFSLCQYERWRSEPHEKELTKYLQKQAMIWSEPRSLFDAGVEYLSNQRIALPAYSTLQKLISQIVVSVHSGLVKRLNASLSNPAKQAIAAFLEGEGELSLRQLRQSARNFTGAELAKELAVHRHVAQWIPEVSAALNGLALSQKTSNILPNGLTITARNSSANRSIISVCIYCAICNNAGKKHRSVLLMALSIM
jgi:hypothetical protein